MMIMMTKMTRNGREGDDDDNNNGGCCSMPPWAKKAGLSRSIDQERQRVDGIMGGDRLHL